MSINIFGFGKNVRKQEGNLIWKFYQNILVLDQVSENWRGNFVFEKITGFFEANYIEFVTSVRKCIYRIVS